MAKQKVWLLLSASGYTSDSTVEVFGTKEKAQKAFDEQLKDDLESDDSGLEHFLDDIKEKVSFIGDIEDMTPEIEKKYIEQCKKEGNYRYDYEVIVDVSLLEKEVD